MRKRLQRVRNISLKRLFLAGSVLAIVMVLSISGYLTSRHNTNQESTFGDISNPDRVDVVAWITRVDATAEVFRMTIIEVDPRGKLADAEGNFPADTTLLTNGVGNWRTVINGGDSSPDIEQDLTIGGSVTDYPFDEHESNFEIRVVDSRGKELPTVVTLKNIDPFFKLQMTQNRGWARGMQVHILARRSTPTLVFAGFVMVLMLGLAAAAAVAAYYVLNWKRGLVLGASSLMAAILFALIPLRNAVPGSPPIGSIIDFGSFFIAEAVISISLISSIIFGFGYQMAIERGEPQAEDASAGALSGQAAEHHAEPVEGSGSSGS